MGNGLVRESMSFLSSVEVFKHILADDLSSSATQRTAALGSQMRPGVGKLPLNRHPHRKYFSSCHAFFSFLNNP
jgi:hypothetical protein